MIWRRLVLSHPDIAEAVSAHLERLPHLAGLIKEIHFRGNSAQVPRSTIEQPSPTSPPEPLQVLFSLCTAVTTVESPGGWGYIETILEPLSTSPVASRLTSLTTAGDCDVGTILQCLPSFTNLEKLKYDYYGFYGEEEFGDLPLSPPTTLRCIKTLDTPYSPVPRNPFYNRLFSICDTSTIEHLSVTLDSDDSPILDRISRFPSLVALTLECDPEGTPAFLLSEVFPLLPSFPTPSTSVAYLTMSERRPEPVGTNPHPARLHSPIRRTVRHRQPHYPAQAHGSESPGTRPGCRCSCSCRRRGPGGSAAAGPWRHCDRRFR